MFTAVRRDALRWETPDPEEEWMMVGHVLVRDSGCVLVDPPNVPGLIESISRMGRIEGVVLTTLDHSRGAAYIVKKTGARLFLPDQSPDDVDPRALKIMKEVTEFEKFSSGKVLGLKVFRLSIPGKREIGMPSMNEYALLTEHKELLTGDFVMGSNVGRLLVAPEWFPTEPANPAYQPAHNEFRNLVHKTEAVSLLASHGYDIYNNLQKEVERL